MVHMSFDSYPHSVYPVLDVAAPYSLEPVEEASCPGLYLPAEPPSSLFYKNGVFSGFQKVIVLWFLSFVVLFGIFSIPRIGLYSFLASFIPSFIVGVLLTAAWFYERAKYRALVKTVNTVKQNLADVAGKVKILSDGFQEMPATLGIVIGTAKIKYLQGATKDMRLAYNDALASLLNECITLGANAVTKLNLEITPSPGLMTITGVALRI